MKKAVLKQFKTNLAKMAVFFTTVHGMPKETVFEMINDLGSDLDKMRFCINFYKKHKKYCKKNGIIVHYNEIIT